PQVSVSVPCVDPRDRRGLSNQVKSQSFQVSRLKSSYITSAQQAQQLPDFPYPEVAFVGRSNVGKSSLLNAILQRRGLARTSNTPGRTQMVNFFSVELGEKHMILADLPGCGYSAIGKDARKDW